MEKYVVQIIEYDTGEVVKQFKPEGKRSAERIERGVNINLNHFHNINQSKLNNFSQLHNNDFSHLHDINLKHLNKFNQGRNNDMSQLRDIELNNLNDWNQFHRNGFNHFNHAHQNRRNLEASYSGNFLTEIS